MPSNHCDSAVPWHRFFFDSEHVAVGDVIQPGIGALSKFTSQANVFLMYIFGGNGDSMTVGESNKRVIGSKMEIGVAVSQNGINWSKVEGPAAYCSIVEVGKEATDFDAMFVGWPSVLEVGKDYRMYYNTFNPMTKKFTIGLAIASDGLMKWIKRGPVFDGGQAGDFDAKGASRRHILQLADKTFKMYYEGVSDDNIHSIGVATSTDGIRWSKVQNAPIFEKSSELGAWDSGGVSSPHLVWLPEKKKWRMYYVGYPPKDNSGDTGNVPNGIGVAESVDESGLVFERI